MAGYDTISRLSNPDYDENDENSLEDICTYEALQKIVPEGECIIVTELCHEKLRYVNGYVVVITSDKIESIDLINDSEELARGLLKEQRMDKSNKEQDDVINTRIKINF